MKKRVSSGLSKKLIGCMILLVILFMFNLYLLIYLFPEIEVTGSSITTASVGFVIEGELRILTILSPSNTTYNFGSEPYIIDLNVSTNFAVDNWWYTLWDLKHNEIINDSVGFSPNTTFNAVR